MNRVLITVGLSKQPDIYIELSSKFKLGLDQMRILHHYPGGFQGYLILNLDKQRESVLFRPDEKYNYWLIIYRGIDSDSRLKFILGEEENIGIIYDSSVIIKDYQAKIDQKWISENIHESSTREQEFIINMIDGRCYIEYE